MRTMKAVSLIYKPAALALVLALAGCGGLLKSDYQTPATQAPAAWSHGAGAQAPANALAAGGAWWEALKYGLIDEIIAPRR